MNASKRLIKIICETSQPKQLLELSKKKPIIKKPTTEEILKAWLLI